MTALRQRQPREHNAQHLSTNAFWIVVEVDGIDVLILLGRVLCIGNGAVRESCEELRVGLHPGVIRSSLECQI